MSWVLPAFLIVAPFSDRLISSVDKIAANILSSLKPKRKKKAYSFFSSSKRMREKDRAVQQFTFAIRLGSAYAIPAAHYFEARRSGRVIFGLLVAFISF